MVPSEQTKLKAKILEQTLAEPGGTDRLAKSMCHAVSLRISYNSVLRQILQESHPISPALSVRAYKWVGAYMQRVPLPKENVYEQLNKDITDAAKRIGEVLDQTIAKVLECAIEYEPPVKYSSNIQIDDLKKMCRAETIYAVMNARRFTKVGYDPGSEHSLMSCGYKASFTSECGHVVILVSRNIKNDTIYLVNKNAGFIINEDENTPLVTFDKETQEFVVEYKRGIMINPAAIQKVALGVKESLKYTCGCEVVSEVKPMQCPIHDQPQVAQDKPTKFGPFKTYVPALFCSNYGTCKVAGSAGILEFRKLYPEISKNPYPYVGTICPVCKIGKLTHAI